LKLRFFNTYEPVSPLLRTLTPYLSRRGVEVDLVLSKAPYRAGQPLGDYLRDLPGVRVIETPSFGFSPNSPVGKLLVILAYVGFATSRSLFGGHVDLNVFLTQPPLFGIWGYALRLIRRQRYACILLDLHPHMLVALGFLPRESVRARLAFAISRLAARNAEKVIVVGRCMQEQAVEMGIAPDRIHVVPNWADHDSVFPVRHEENDFRQSHEWRDRFVVMYAGNIGHPQTFDDLLAAAKMLTAREDIQFLFVGGGAREAAVKAACERLRLANVSFLPFLQAEYPLAEVMSAADLHFVTLRDACVGLAVPSKAYSALAAGRPILYQGAAEGEIARLVVEHGVGAVAASNHPARLVDAILHYADDRSRWADECSRAHAIAAEHYDGRAAVEELSRILDEAASPP